MSEETEPPTAKKPKFLIAKYKPSVLPGRTHPANINVQIADYPDMIGDQADDNCMSLWDRNRLELNKRPASSSPVERVFSQGGID